MPRIIDHDERKDAILYQALEVFREVGFKDASLSLIAERCGINRPSLYLYFKDKNEIFYYTVKRYTDKMYLSYLEVSHLDISYGDKLKKIFKLLFDQMETERQLLEILTNFYFNLRQEGNLDNFNRHISRRTIQFKRLLHTLLKQGEDKGEFKRGSATQVGLLFNLCHSSLIQMGLFKMQQVDFCIAIADAVVDQILLDR